MKELKICDKVFIAGDHVKMKKKGDETVISGKIITKVPFWKWFFTDSNLGLEKDNSIDGDIEYYQAKEIEEIEKCEN